MNYAELKTAIRGYVENDFPTINMTDSSTVWSSDDQLAMFVQQAEQRIYNSVQFPSLRKNAVGGTSANNPYLTCPDDFLAPYSLAVYSYAQPTGTGTSGAYTVTVSDALNIQTGQFVFGTGIATGAQVVSISGTTVTLNITNTATVSGVLTFQSKYFYLLNKDVNFIREAYPIPTGAGNTGRPRHYAIFGPYVVSGTITNELSFILGPTPDISYNVELHYYYYPESIVTAGTTWLSENFDTVLLYGALREGYFFIKAEAEITSILQSKYDEAMTLAKRLGDGMERQDAYRSGQVRYPVK